MPSFLYAAHNTAPLAQQFISALRPFFLGVCALPIALLTRYTGHVKALAIGGALTFLTGMGLMFGTNGEAASLSRMALAQFLLGAGEALCFGVTEALVLSNVSASLSSTLHMSLLLVTAVGRALGASFCGALWAARLPGLLNSALLPLHAHSEYPRSHLPATTLTSVSQTCSRRCSPSRSPSCPRTRSRAQSALRWSTPTCCSSAPPSSPPRPWPDWRCSPSARCQTHA